MAKRKTAEELRAEAKELIKKAKEQEQNLLKQAKEMEETIAKELGEFVLKQAKSNTLSVDSIYSKIQELGV